MARLHSPEQIREKGGVNSLGGYGRAEVFDRASRVRWVEGFSLTTSARRWFPRTRCTSRTSPARRRRAPAGTAPPGWRRGHAGGGDHGAVCEWIERDAFVISWLNRFVRARWRWTTGDPHLLHERFNYGHPQVDLRVFDTTLDVQVPSRS
jgi:ribosomal protein S12 methylthiotransferase accessory factor YcaO